MAKALQKWNRTLVDLNLSHGGRLGVASGHKLAAMLRTNTVLRRLRIFGSRSHKSIWGLRDEGGVAIAEALMRNEHSALELLDIGGHHLSLASVRRVRPPSILSTK